MLNELNHLCIDNHNEFTHDLTITFGNLLRLSAELQYLMAMSIFICSGKPSFCQILSNRAWLDAPSSFYTIIKEIRVLSHCTKALATYLLDEVRQVYKITCKSMYLTSSKHIHKHMYNHTTDVHTDQFVQPQL